MYIKFGVCFYFLVVSTDAAPVREAKDIVFIPTNRISPVFQGSPQQTRGPFDFIGTWIQQSDWFPLEFNIPDIFTGIGNNFQSSISNIGSGLQNFSSNVSNVAGNFFQRIPFLSNVVGQNNINNNPQRYFVLVPIENMPGGNKVVRKPAGILGMDSFQNDVLNFPMLP